MDGRSRIKALLDGRRSDRVARALFGGGLWSFRQAGLDIEELPGDPDRFSAAVASVFGAVDTDIIFAGSGLNSFPAEAIGGKLDFRENQAPLLAFPLIETAADARFLTGPAIADSPCSVALVEMIAGLRKRLPDRYICATSWGPFTWAMILCDLPMLREKTVGDRPFIHEVCELGVRLTLAFYEPLISRGLIDGISVPEGAVTLISDELYREVVLPCERRLFQALKSRGIGCFLHQCGNIARQIPLYPGTGADCITVDSGVPIGEVYGRYRSSLVTAGNLDVINVLFGGSREDIRRAVADAVAAIPDPLYRYILMPSCDLPPDTPLRNVRDFLDSVPA